MYLGKGVQKAQKLFSDKKCNHGTVLASEKTTSHVMARLFVLFVYLRWQPLPPGKSAARGTEEGKKNDVPFLLGVILRFSMFFYASI
jgi:hypothetical protein